MTEAAEIAGNTSGDGTFSFHGFSSLPGSTTPKFLCPLFNKAGVVDGDGTGRQVVDYTATEWRKLMTKYGRHVKVILADFASLTQTGGRVSDVRMEMLQKAMHECETMLDAILDNINDQAETWYNSAGRTRSEQSDPDWIDSSSTS